MCLLIPPVVPVTYVGWVVGKVPESSATALDLTNHVLEYSTSIY